MTAGSERVYFLNFRFTEKSTMMNVKKYRAATTRKALEQIKQDLGENAFVLETKQVRTGGFLGINSQMQIEISAAVPDFAAKPVTNQPKPERATIQSLDLKDETIASPQSYRNAEDEKKNIMKALNSRAVSSENFQTAVSFAPAAAANAFSRQSQIEAVEITSEAPRVIHTKKETNNEILPEQNSTVAEPAENISTTMSSREFELLRAELREVKFSLGIFANNQNARALQENYALQDFEEVLDSPFFEEVFDSPFYDSYLRLTLQGVPAKAARQMIADIIPQYKNGLITENQLSEQTLIQALSSQIKFESNLLDREKPAVIAVIGATGVGKTTTIAKLAARVALHERRRVELVTLDTYRIAAVEQLKTYAEIIGAGCQVVQSTLELDAVLRRMPSDATILIDTTGRNPHDLADQFEFSDYLRQHPEIRKCLAVQSTIHPLDGIAAINKFAMYGADCLALTKLDETTRPGALLELAAESRLPLAYLCMGQRVPEDLQIATPESFTNHILRRKN
jgi:flagellar biosynthesis protein FlhF